MKDLTLKQLEEMQYGNTVDLQNILADDSLSGEEKLQHISGRILQNYLTVHNVLAAKL